VVAQRGILQSDLATLWNLGRLNQPRTHLGACHLGSAGVTPTGGEQPVPEGASGLSVRGLRAGPAMCHRPGATAPLNNSARSSLQLEKLLNTVGGFNAAQSSMITNQPWNVSWFGYLLLPKKFWRRSRRRLGFDGDTVAKCCIAAAIPQCHVHLLVVVVQEGCHRGSLSLSCAPQFVPHGDGLNRTALLYNVLFISRVKICCLGPWNRGIEGWEAEEVRVIFAAAASQGCMKP
jgi:hypothetical protein